jgi:hypothetical protein
VLLLLPAQRNFAHEDSMIRAKNSLYAALFCALATFFLAMPAKGDSVQIATFDIATIGCPVCLQTVSLSNLTSITLTGTSFDENGFAALPGDFPISVGPGPTLPGFFGCEGSCYLNTYTVHGILSSLDFATGGQNYQATNLDWTAPTYSASLNTSVPIDINASLVAVPEPASLSLYSWRILYHAGDVSS